MSDLLPLPRRNRYGMRNTPAAKLARTYRGVEYASRPEALYAARLDLLQRADPTFVGWHRGASYAFVVHGVRVGSYRPDFSLTNIAGDQHHVELKSPGTDTQVCRLRRRLFRACYPAERLILVDSRTFVEIPDPTLARSKRKAPAGGPAGASFDPDA